MTDAEIYRELAAIFHETFDDDTILLRPEMSAPDVKGWDSLRMIMLIVAVEERFSIKTRTHEIDRLQCVGDFVAMIKAKLPKATAPAPMLRAIFRHGQPGHFLQALRFDDDYHGLIDLVADNQPPPDGSYICFVGVLDSWRVPPAACARVGEPHFSAAIETAVIEDFRRGRAMLVLDLSNEGPEFEESTFDAIHAFVDERRIPERSVVWLSQNRAVEAHYIKAYQGKRRDLIKFECYDYYIKLMAHWFSSPDWLAQTIGNSSAYATALQDPLRKTRLALCLNATPRVHRIYTVAALKHYGVMDRCLVSFGGADYAKGGGVDLDLMHAILDRWQLAFLRRACAEVLAGGRLRVDHFGETGNQLVAKIDVHNYLSTFFSIVTETDFSDGEIDRITEKTVKIFCLGHPCFIVGNPGSLRFATGLGFQTFAPACPDGYDDIKSAPQRFLAVHAEMLAQIVEIQRDPSAWLARTAEISRHNIRYATSGLLRNYKENHDKRVVQRLQQMLAENRSLIPEAREHHLAGA